ncbi:PREDICTED: uncharacterized protein LOC106110838 isoform X2 [Papilio polytes]|uniref:uncharacterized protein LOC106110838 isoform X2 n=1 Tax=Papilio polytes TaxID=76194 RepID=UPI0006767A9D|nr:PREDICTED: uncharacterized protein LOC106110838 isoform X2 [Papilio polytes]
METSTVEGEDEYKSTRTFSEETTVPEILSSAEKLTLFDFANINKTFSETEIIRTASDICRINYLRQQDSSLSAESIKVRNDLLFGHRTPSQESVAPQTKAVEEMVKEQYFPHVTNLMNEDQFWGCFYPFSELYSDMYSPVVRVKKPEDVPEVPGGVLTHELVGACLSYLKRIPLLGDFVFIKLDLSSKTLTNIDILKQYKFLVYLDLSSNFLTDLSVLSYLPYLQYLSVSFNRLNTVLNYETPQWFLTEVHYKYNSIIRIRDLSEFWSITVLDLSHNNIKRISGFENLRYLRHLDLSFNHIQRLENLNHLRLLWLDLSYNNISSFEFSQNTGLWTLLDLKYLNISENNLICMKMFSGCTRLRELYARNNRLGVLLELAVYLRQMRRLIILDLRSNPVCSTPGYKDVIYISFPNLINLDGEAIDPIEQQYSKIQMMADVRIFASRRLLRLLYIEQLSKACVSPFTPPADTTDVPLVVIVGYDAVGKSTLARRLVKECSSNIELGRQHTTATHHYSDHYITVTRKKFDDMIIAGEFLTYSEKDGESYGLSREEAYVNKGKVRLVTMDLISGLMLKQRGRRPYLILASCSDKSALFQRQQERKEAHNADNVKKLSMMLPQEISTLQILLSGRIIITGILNEIILALPDVKDHSEFLLASECSLKVDSETKHDEDKVHKAANKFGTMTLSSSSFRGYGKKVETNNGAGGTSMYSLYKSQGTGEYVSEADGQLSFQDKNSKRSEHRGTIQKGDKQSNVNKSVDFTKYTSSTWKGGVAVVYGSTKSSKSVTFTSQDIEDIDEHVPDTSGLIIEPQPDIDPESTLGHENKDELDYLIKQIEHHKIPSESYTTNIRDDYEDIHRKIPGLFWNTVSMDNPDLAFKKMKRIIQDIVNSQKELGPMFDTDFSNMNHPIIQNRLKAICSQIAPRQLFL